MQIAGLRVSANRLFIPGTLALCTVAASAYIVFARAALSDAIFFGIGAAILHWLAVIAHQLGHAFAARSTGYPMNGIRFGYAGLLSASRYPDDEPPLPARVHIRRALGGPLASLLVAIVAGFALNAWRGAIPDWLLLFFFLDNLLVFTFGSLLPLGFTDGSTLLEWRQKQKE